MLHDKRIEGEISMYRLFVKNCSLISRGSRVNAHLLVANKYFFFFFLYHVILYHVFDNNVGWRYEAAVRNVSITVDDKV